MISKEQENAPTIISLSRGNLKAKMCIECGGKGSIGAQAKRCTSCNGKGYVKYIPQENETESNE